MANDISAVIAVTWVLIESCRYAACLLQMEHLRAQAVTSEPSSHIRPQDLRSSPITAYKPRMNGLNYHRARVLYNASSINHIPWMFN